MDYRELEPAPIAALPLEALRDHLRLGRGFADDAVEEGVLEDALRAAIDAVERRVGRALIRRRFWMPCAFGAARLPLAEAEVEGVDLAGPEGTEAAAGWSVLREGDALRVVGIRGGRDDRPSVRFAAGFGAWEDVPKDLAFAVLSLAAAFHDARGAHVRWPDAALALAAPWKRLRIGGAA
ncbi:hypothetical protein BCF33_0986 [Hasllibacter halocynthiae]|uniref:PhiE125 gp8 family phage protein n=1 Tax=Hasllibacter halocynthiae TaxID=595589 RepID=A0A2T0X8U3_9RHOB|nr:hypothetical protein [Hasllibacter halocynthiae]PRY95368.1 hypothetical protein BCF33_0986 [Hasllibacter halocynthiae]